jgi:diaminopimelate epimerase
LAEASGGNGDGKEESSRPNGSRCVATIIRERRIMTEDAESCCTCMAEDTSSEALMSIDTRCKDMHEN